MGHDDDPVTDSGPGPRPPRPDEVRRSYIAPPTIRTTGELPAVFGRSASITGPLPAGPVSTPTPGDHASPAVTGEMPAVPLESEVVLIDPATGQPLDGDRPDAWWTPGGSIVDHPPAAAPDWMSGVQVPEMLVTQTIPRDALRPPLRQRLGAATQRLLGFVLLTLLVAVVVLVVVGSITGLGARLR